LQPWQRDITQSPSAVTSLTSSRLLLFCTTLCQRSSPCTSVTVYALKWNCVDRANSNWAKTLRRHESFCTTTSTVHLLASLLSSAHNRYRSTARLYCDNFRCRHALFGGNSVPISAGIERKFSHGTFTVAKRDINKRQPIDNTWRRRRRWPFGINSPADDSRLLTTLGVQLGVYSVTVDWTQGKGALVHRRAA